MYPQWVWVLEKEKYFEGGEKTLWQPPLGHKTTLYTACVVRAGMAYSEDREHLRENDGEERCGPSLKELLNPIKFKRTRFRRYNLQLSLFSNDYFVKWSLKAFRVWRKARAVNLTSIRAEKNISTTEYNILKSSRGERTKNSFNTSFTKWYFA